MTPLGSFAVTFGCFALPSFLHWKLVPNMTTGQKVVDWILIVLGLTLMVVITTLSIVKLFPVCFTINIFFIKNNIRRCIN